MTREYELIARAALAPGDWAEPFRAHARAGREGAPQAALLKMLLPRVREDADLEAALARAVARAAALGGPGILAPWELGEAQGKAFVAAPFVEGLDCNTLLTRLGTREALIGIPVTVELLARACEAVAAANEAGVTHGGLGPGNVVCGWDGRVWVTDFAVRAAVDASATFKRFAGRGRHAYRAPELVHGARPDAATDVFALGALCYELLTARPMGKPGQRGVSTRREALAPPSRVDRRVPGRLDGPVVRALDPARTKRFHSPRDLAHALRDFLASEKAAPGDADLAKALKEVFPTEVQIGKEPACEGSVPAHGWFALAPLAGVDARPAAGDAPFAGAPAPAEPPEPDEGPPTESMPPFSLETVRVERPVFDDEPAPAPEPRPLGETAPDLPPLQKLSAAAAPPVTDRVAARIPSQRRVSSPAMAPRPALRPRTPSSPRAGAPPAPKKPLEATAAATGPLEREDAPEPGEEKEPTSEQPLPGALVAEAVKAAKTESLPPLEPPKKPSQRRFLFLAVAAGAVTVAVLALLGRKSAAPADEVPLAAIDKPKPIVAPPLVAPPEDLPPPRTAATPARKPGWLTIHADVRARVYVDGKDTGAYTPVRRLRVAGGKHRLRLLNARRRIDQEMEIEVPEGHERTVHAMLRRG